MKPGIIILCLPLLLGCNTVNKPLTETQKKVVLEEGQKRVIELFNALAVFDMDKIISMSDTTDQGYMIVIGDQVYSMGDDAMKDLTADLLKQTFETKKEKYIVIDAASFIYFWNGENDIYMKSGDTIKNDNYFLSYVFRKVNEDWMFLYGHESYQMPKPDSTLVTD